MHNNNNSNLAGALYVVQLQLSPPLPPSLFPIKPRMDTFRYRLTWVR